jgi:outer membrane receptor protein involved in Fe transport
MMRRTIAGAAALLAALAGPAEAQFSSDIPGVPRATVPFRGTHQNRTEVTFAGYRVPGGGAEEDTLALGMRVSFGRSYRVLTRFEVGIDLTVADGLIVRTPAQDAAQGEVDYYPRGVTLYGIRIGGKVRPFSALDVAGQGFELAIGGAIQPALRPVFGVEHFGDSTRTGGQFSKDVDGGALRDQDPFTRTPSATFLSGMASYRARRVLADAALVVEKVEERGNSAAVASYTGVSPRAGFVFRLTPGLAVGASYWGSGAPPWRDQNLVGIPGAQKEESYGVVIALGARPEAGMDLMLSSPTGAWGESIRLYIRTRSTR